MFEFSKHVLLGKKLWCKLERINVCYVLMYGKDQSNGHSKAVVLDEA